MNFKSISINILAVLLLLTGYHFLFNTKSYSLAYVDSAKLMTEYKGMADVKKIVKTKEKAWQATIDTQVGGKLPGWKCKGLVIF